MTSFRKWEKEHRQNTTPCDCRRGCPADIDISGTMRTWGLLVFEWDRIKKTKVKPWQDQVVRYDKWGYAHRNPVLGSGVIVLLILGILCGTALL